MVAQAKNLPIPVGGAGRLAEAFAGAAIDAGVTIVTDAAVKRVIVRGGKAVGVETVDGRSFSASKAVVADTHARNLFGKLVAEDELGPEFMSRLRWFRPGSGMFKLDLALSGIPNWQVEGLDRTGVVHIIGTTHTMARAYGQIEGGRLPDEPMLICGQQSIADPTRAPQGGQTLWVETHVPSHPDEGDWPEITDMFRDRVIDRIAAFAPGLREQIVGVAVNTPPISSSATPTLSTATSAAAAWGSISNSCSDRCADGSATTRRSRGCTSARPPPIRAAACTAWPGATAPSGSCESGSGVEGSYFTIKTGRERETVIDHRPVGRARRNNAGGLWRGR